MQQLSGQDASFIYSERPHAPTHITSIGIYDPSTAPGGEVSFEQILEHIDARLHLAWAFRRRVVRVPADLDHPYWIEDGDFDLEYHVRQIALPRPGDWQQFCVQASRLHARPLDMSRPLWELYVVEGLDAIDGVPEGSFGTVLKVHHAAVDGKSGVEMITVIHTQSPEIVDPPPPTVPWQAEDEPSPMWLYGQAMANAVRVPGRAMRLSARLTPGLGRAMRTMQQSGGDASAELAPGTRFAGPVTGHRVMDAEFFPFAALRPIRDLVPGATVNDVALAILGGALRTYLADIGELPGSAMRAMTPVSVRTEAEKADLGNQVSAMVVSLATDIADPAERLAAVHRSTSSSKDVTEAIGARNLTELSQLAPGLLIGVGTRLGARFARRGNSGVVNTVVTNVPGPREPLFLAGAECLRSFGAGPVVDGMGIINIVTSYDDQFILSFTACREMMPDPERYAAAIRSSFDEYVAAAEAARPAAAPTARHAPARQLTVAIAVEPSGQVCGARVTGVDLSGDLDDATVAELRAAWLEHHVLAFPDQRLDDDDLERFTLRFGPFGDDPYIAPIAGREHVIAVSRRADETAPLFAENWHSDWSFQARPPDGTCLYGVTIPPRGGDTLYADQHAALDAMPDDLRERLTGRLAVHSARGGYAPSGMYGAADQRTDRSMDIRPSASAMATQLHPIVRDHPETGRPGLFGCVGYVIGIDGMDDDDARPLLGEWYAWQTCDEFVYRHRWEPDMLVMWDNRSLLHKATGGYDGYDRVLHRTTIGAR